MSYFVEYEANRDIKLAETLTNTIKLVQLFDKHFKQSHRNTDSYYTIINLISNRNFPSSKLEEAIKSDDMMIKYRIAIKPNLNRKIYESLSVDLSEDVRGGVASNKTVPIDLLEKLSNDLTKHVSRCATATLNRIKQESI